MFEAVDDINFANLSMNDDEKFFHMIIGHIEDIVMNDDFTLMHTAFMDKHWTHFDDSEENKLIYTDIFNEYQTIIEKYLENELVNREPQFNMTEFETELRVRRNELDGEIFEILATFYDFCAFKTMFIDYKNMKEGKMIDFTPDFNICKCEVVDANNETFVRQ